MVNDVWLTLTSKPVPKRMTFKTTVTSLWFLGSEVLTFKSSFPITPVGVKASPPSPFGEILRSSL